MSYNDILIKQIPVDEDCLLDNVRKNFKKKANSFLIFRELIKNSLESIRLKNNRLNGYNYGTIDIELFFKNDLVKNDSESFLEKIIITDNGIGFDKENFERFSKYSSNKKGFNNKGTARFYLLAFEDSLFESIYNENDKKKFVKFSFSEKNDKKSCFIKIMEEKEINNTSNLKTKITITNSEINGYNYDLLNAKALKDYILQTFLLDFISNKEYLPSIKITEYIDEKQTKIETISNIDIPKIDFFEDIQINYYDLIKGEKDRITPVAVNDKFEKFKLEFIKSDKINKNLIILFSNGTRCDEYNIPILKKDEKIDGQGIFVLVSGDILDKEYNYNNERDGFNILLTEGQINAFKKSLFSVKESFLKTEDLLNKVSAILYEHYAEIKTKRNEILKKLKDITNTFCVDEEIAKKIKSDIRIDSTTTEIINSISEQESKKIAKLNNELYLKLETIKNIDTTLNDSENKIEALTTEILNLIPQQNKNELSKYIARRKIILELFSRMLNGNMNISNKIQEEQNILEKHFHNLILKQHTENNEDISNLWIINEDFIYFNGVSETKLEDLKIENGKRVFTPDFFRQENEYFRTLNEERLKKRPDILLFPQTNKCIIIELKKPGVDVSSYTTQINKYASFINSFCSDDIRFNLFYGYLIGNDFDMSEVVAADADFKYSYNNEYLFRSNKAIADISSQKNKGESSLYTEIHTYSSLLKMAEIKNRIFMEKLGLYEKTNKNN